VFPARYFNVRYYASRFWAKVGGTSVVIGPTPATRTAMIPPENRNVIVASESRSVLVPPENRTVVVR
jgi:hypothetical protein